MAVRHLPRDELEQIGGGQAVAGAPIALLGPGTGLGVSGLIPAGEHWIPLQGEGGHVTLSVMNEREIAVLRAAASALLACLRRTRAVGPGLVNLYDALVRARRRRARSADAAGNHAARARRFVPHLPGNGQHVLRTARHDGRQSRADARRSGRRATSAAASCPASAACSPARTSAIASKTRAATPTICRRVPTFVIHSELPALRRTGDCVRRSRDRAGSGVAELRTLRLELLDCR